MSEFKKYFEKEVNNSLTEKVDKKDPILDNQIKSQYYKIADNLSDLVYTLDLASDNGSEIAKEELSIYKQMLKLFDKSRLGQIF